MRSADEFLTSFESYVELRSALKNSEEAKEIKTKSARRASHPK